MPRKATATAPVAEDVAQAQTRLVPLDQLYLHPLNPRQEPPEAEIEALATSIAAVGLLQNLSGFADHQIRFRLGHQDGKPDHTGIVAGGRRLRALQLLAQRGEWQSDVPVNITTDADLAGQWAGAENETQRGLSEVDRITAYAQMKRTGHSVEAIASAFATPVSDVRRLLALVILPDAALDALRAGRINIDIAKALTYARDDATQTAALNSALAGKDAWSVKNMLRQGTISGSDRRAKFVGLQAYHDAGGTSTLNLFEDETILHDAGLLEQLVATKAEEETEALREAEGWLWAKFVPSEAYLFTQGMKEIYGKTLDLPEGDAARLDELEQIPDEDSTDEELAEYQALRQRKHQRHFTDADRETSGIVTTIDQHGKLKREGAYRRKQDEPRAEGDDGSIEINPAAEASMPQNLKDDLQRIRLICIQDALRRDDQLLHLLALQLSRRLKPWENPFALDQAHALAPIKVDGMIIPAELAMPKTEGTGEDAATALTAWLQVGEMTINAALQNGLARAFRLTGGPFVDAIHARQPINARALWTPNATNFFARVSAGYLDALWRQLVPDEGSRHAGFASLTKKEKAKELDKLFSDWATREAMGLSREDNTRIDAWLPEELRFGAPAEEVQE